MEVKEAIEYLEQIKRGQPMTHPNLRGNYINQTGIDDVKSLLKSLESENKKLKKENKELKADREWHHLPKLKYLGGGE